jgi:hypothetical protein
MDKDEQTKAAFASASDASKQLITLATGLLGLEITFAKDMITTLDETSKYLVGVSWILLLLSVIAGVWTLLALTGSLGEEGTALTPKAISGRNVRIPATLQILLFLVGLLVTVWFGMRYVNMCSGDCYRPIPACSGSYVFSENETNLPLNSETVSTKSSYDSLASATYVACSISSLKLKPSLYSNETISLRKYSSSVILSCTSSATMRQICLKIRRRFRLLLL